MQASGRLRLEILAGGAILVLALWGVLALLVYQERVRTEQDAAATGRNLARTLAEYQDSSMRAIDLSLRQLREHWLRDPARFAAAVAQHEEHLKKEKVIQVAVIDREAWTVYSRLPLAKPLNFADRDYFQVQKSRATDELHISPPVMGRVTKQWAIQVTRPIFDADKRFAGVIVVAVPPPALELVLQDIQLGPHGVIMLARPDGTILARSGGLERASQATIAGWAGLGDDGPAAGEFREASRVDGIERFYAYRKLRDYPLTVYVGQEVNAALAPYYRERNVLFGGGVLATVLLFAVGLLLMARERERAQFVDARERLMLELHDSSIQSLYAIGLSLEAGRRRLQDQPQTETVIAQAGANLNLVIQDLRGFINAERRGPYSGQEFMDEIERMLPPPEEGAPRFSVDIDRALIPNLSPRQAGHLLRITREAISNIVRHARARSARVVLQGEGGRVRLEVSDDGVGLGARTSESHGMGLPHIQARARDLRGRATIERSPNGGTRVAVEFPYRP